MRIFSEKRQLALKNDSFAEAQKQGEVGRFNIRMTRKQASMLDARRFTLDVMERVNWVEDGFHIVMGQMLFSSDSLLPYLGIAYPSTDLMSANECHTETKDERRTLLFRLRHMLRSLKTVKDRFELFEQWRFSGLEFAMQSFDYMIQQAFGPVAHDTFYDLYRRLRRLWKAVAPELDSPEDVEREIDSLIDQAEAVFATLRRCCEIKEAEIAQAKRDAAKLLQAAKKVEEVAEKVEEAAEKVEDAAQNVTSASSDIRETNRLSRKAVNVVEHIAGIANPRIYAAEDMTSREAGLQKLNPSRKCEILAASKISHNEFPISINAKSGEHSLFLLAKKTWARHRDDFERLATLKTAPGYATSKDLYFALYRLAKNYPEAAHFQWLPNS